MIGIDVWNSKKGYQSVVLVIAVIVSVIALGEKTKGIITWLIRKIWTVYISTSHITCLQSDEYADPIKLELYKNILTSVAEEMGVTLQRTAFSPNIKERLDFSCAVFDGAGKNGRSSRAYPGSSRLYAALRSRRN